jgi:hypothetical protein
MARYIDADKLWNDRPQIPEGKSQDYGAGFSECMWGFSQNIRKQIDTESADVVPKSEVQQLKQDLEIAKIAIENRNIEIEAMRGAANSYKMHYEKSRQEVAREIFEEIEKHSRFQTQGISPFRLVIDDNIYKEIKNKYTGEQI